MLHIILLVTLVLFFTLMGIIGVIQTKRLLKTDIDEKVRVQTYATTTFGLWIPVIVLFSVIVFSDITFVDIGFTLLSFDLNIVVTIIVMIAAFLFSAYFIFYRIIAFLFSAKHRQKRKKILDEQAKGSDYYELVTSKLMTPRTKREKRWWVCVSLAAGICEEIIFRGAYIFLLISIFPNLSIYLVFAITVVLFGLGHFYQGAKGLIISSLVGALFTAIYIVSGSLIIVVVIHILTDFANAFEYSHDDADELAPRSKGLSNIQRKTISTLDL